MSTVEDLGDSLVRLWDLWFQSWSAADLAEWSASDDFLDEVRTRADGILASGSLEESDLDPSGVWHAFVVVSAIDGAFERAHPRTRGLSAPRVLAGVVSRWSRFRRLDTGITPGRVAIWAGGASVHRDDPYTYFRSVRVIDSSTYDEINFVRPPLADRISPFVGAHGQPLRVACMPFYSGPDDLRFSVVDSDRFIVNPAAPATTDSIVGRLLRLDQLDVDLAICPEAVLDLETLKRWKGALAANKSVGRLRWIIVGTGAVSTGQSHPPVNEAVLLSRITGAEIMRQRKRRGFSLNEHRLGEWRLENVLGKAAGVVEEWTYYGTDWNVLDDGAFRFAVAICEDLARHDEASSALRATRPTHVLSPILDTELRPGGWPDEAARQWYNVCGSSTVVSNSEVIAARRGEATPKSSLAQDGVLPPSYTEDVYPGPSRLAGADASTGAAVHEV